MTDAVTEAPIEFGRADDVDFGDVVLTPGGLPAATAAEPASFAPPAAPLPADMRPAPPGVHAGSDLQRLVGELKRELSLDDVVLPVPVRPSFEARYRLILDQHEMQPWRRDSYDPTSLEGIDTAKLARLGLAALNTGLLLDGREVRGDSGGLLTFGSAEILAMLDVTSAPDAVRAFYGLDAHVTASWSAVLAESGFGLVISPVDRLGETELPERPDPS